MAFKNILQPDLFASNDDPIVRPERPRPPTPPAVPTRRELPNPAGWARPEIPHLNGERRIILNCETTGLKWWADDLPIGWAYLLPESGRSGYLGVRHAGGNLPIEQVHAFLRDLRNLHIDNHNTRFDLHMSRVDDVDLIDGTGNTFGDSGHYAALLDDNRRRFKLDEICYDLLGWDVRTDGLGPIPEEIQNEGQFQTLHAARVAPYALRNVRQVQALIDHFDPLIGAEDLGRVLALEQEIIPVVVEFEKNGVHLDMELLHRWRRDAQTRIDDALMLIYRSTGLLISSPDSNKDISALFRKLGIPITNLTENGNPSFTDAYLKTLDKEPCIHALREAGQHAGLMSFLNKYAATARASDGWMRYNLHQLKAVKDSNGPSGDDTAGTISGRFSATGDKQSKYMRPDQNGTGGFNPQQAVAVEKQVERGWCKDFVLRKLFIPGKDEECFFAADMMQVEYRLFAHYANVADAFHDKARYKMINGKLVWIAGPLADFHALVAELLNNPKLNRKLVKNVNFAMIYGAGLIKFALMIGSITEAMFKAFNERLSRKDWSVFKEPALAEAEAVREEYLEMFPDVKPLLDKAKSLAENRGYVHDFLGRRARLLSRFHSALNRIIQGGAATVNKMHLVEQFKLRHTHGFVMRLTVHDEIGGGLKDRRSAYAIKKSLNRQIYPFRAPILWDAHTGANWAECK